MSGAENDPETLDQSEIAGVSQDEADGLFGAYSVLSPGVQIVIAGRPVTAPAPAPE